MSLDVDVTLIPDAFDSFIEGFVVQVLLTGWYSHLLSSTISSAAPRLRNGRHRILVVVLIVLYVNVAVNLAACWGILRSICMSKNETQSQVDIYEELLVNEKISFRVATISSILGPVIADVLLAWRCYILWNKSKWILALFGFLLLGEAASILVLVVLEVYPTGRSIFIPDLYFVSIGVTVIATSLITYRIVTVSRTAGTSDKYRHIIKILIESGVIYCIVLFLTALFEIITLPTVSSVEAAGIVSRIQAPLAGIAPTMIFERILNHREDDEDMCSQSISAINFRRTTRISMPTGQHGVDDRGYQTTADQNSIEATIINDSRTINLDIQDDAEE